MKSEVAVSLCNAYDYGHLKDAIYSSINSVGGRKSLGLSRGDKVLLKINLLAAKKPEQAVTTHPTVAKALIEYFQDAGAEVVLGDSTAAGAAETRRAIRVCGMEQVAREMKVKAVNFEAQGFIKVPAPKDSVHLHELYVARPVVESQLVVSIPKLKNHNLTKFTGAIKNLFGTIPSATRMKLHALGNPKLFSQGLVDVYSVIKPQLGVMDGVVGMDGNGPTYGTIRRAGIIAASRDCVALDAVCSTLVGYGEKEILTTVEASARRVGKGQLSEITVKGVDIEHFRIPWTKVKAAPIGYMPSYLLRHFMRLYYIRPELVKGNCTKCATCQRHCPAHAIRMTPFPKLDYKRCLTCYTCNEVCPNGAYRLKKSLLAKLASYLPVGL